MFTIMNVSLLVVIVAACVVTGIKVNKMDKHWHEVSREILREQRKALGLDKDQEQQ